MLFLPPKMNTYLVNEDIMFCVAFMVLYFHSYTAPCSCLWSSQKLWTNALRLSKVKLGAQSVTHHTWHYKLKLDSFFVKYCNHHRRRKWGWSVQVMLSACFFLRVYIILVTLVSVQHCELLHKWVWHFYEPKASENAPEYSMRANQYNEMFSTHYHSSVVSLLTQSTK